MDDLISRQTAIDKFEPWLKVPGYSEGELNMLKAVLYELRHLPSAERHGRWLYKSELYSYCGHPFYPKICSVCNGVFEYTTNYCPDCGAQMEVE